MIDTSALFKSCWASEIEARKKQAPSFKVSDYKVTGRAPAPYGKRTEQWWLDKGHEFIDKWIAWRLEHREWETWITPDDTPAIELELNIVLPGDIPVKMFIDNMFVVTTTGEIVVVDKKTGRTPETPEQLGLYATGVELTYGEMYRPSWGYWWDAGKGQHVGPYDLSRFTPDYFAANYEEVIRGINAGCFPANPQNSCATWCGVAEWCSAVGGSKANQIPNPS